MSALTVAVPDSPRQPDELFFDDVVRQYVEDPRYVHRAWLEEAVEERLDKPGCRYVVVVGEPGAGKSGVMAGLAARHGDWMRYFIRRDSITPLSGGDAVSMLLRVGHQLAARKPELFDPKRLEVVVTQRVAAAGPGASVVGVRIEDLSVSPFHRTAIRVEQHVADLGGRLVGLDVAHATVEPRLLAEENLQFLALLDPAAALATVAPDARIVVLVDAVDEALRFSAGMSVLDWLERSPELPPNVRIVLSSRPHPRLASLQGVRAGSLELIDLHEAEGDVAGDTRAFTTRLLAAPELAVRVSDPEQVAMRVADASEGNFAYLRAWERGLVAAITDGNNTLADRLLGLEVLPAGLGALYTVFLRSARAEIEQLGSLDIEDPRGPDDNVAPAWEGAGQRVVAVLAVARAPLDVDQVIRLGAIRVWRSATDNVMQRLRPLLDEVDRSWRFFHPSVAEFLTDEAERDAPDLFVSRNEWNQRVVRAYKSAAAWADVDWPAVDDYGLLHLATHLAELDADGRRQIVELVNPGLRDAARQRFLTDLPFQRLVETALANVDLRRAPADALAESLFLALVRKDLRTGGRRLAPAVFGLMARVGRFTEAQARIELLPPGEHRFAAMQALVASTTADERHLLGPHDGADLLVAAATEVPVVDDTLFPGMRSREAIEAAAVALAPHDLDRALALADGAEPDWDTERVHDLVLLTAARALPTMAGARLVDRMAGRRASAAAELACLADVSERGHLVALAEDDLARGRAKERIPALAGLVAAWRPTNPARAEGFAAALRSAAADPNAQLADVLNAAETVLTTDPGLADVMLDQVANAETPGSWEKIRAVRLWADLGRFDKARALAERVLEYERGLGWFGPADSIAQLAAAVDALDPVWARNLADEAEELLINAERANRDPYESRITMTLGQAAEAVRTWDPPRALRLARRMDGSWISGAPWDSFDGRLSALACLGIDASTIDPALARELLDECLPSKESASILGRPDARLVRGGLFRPVEDAVASEPSSSRSTSFASYVLNCVNYWQGARERLPFLEPADVARCMGVAPGVPGSVASWASVVATAILPVAAVDLDSALDLVGWVADPTDRLIAVAGLVAALAAAGDPRVPDAVAAVGRGAVRLPRYVAELDLTRIDQAPMLGYLDPAARARWEAAILLPEKQGTLAASLAMATGSWFLTSTFRAQKLVERLYGSEAAQSDGPEIVDFVRRAIVEADRIPDPIQQDLVRMASLWAVTPWDTEVAGQIVAGIRHPGRAHLGRLYIAALSSTDGAQVAAAVRTVLENEPPDLATVGRIMGFASAMTWLDEEGKRELTNRALAALADADPWSATQGLLILAASAAPERRADLTRAALGRAEGIQNVYLRSDLLADLVAAAAHAGDFALVMSMARRQLEAGWEVLMEGLRRAIEPLIEVAGVGVLQRLDEAFRAAQAIVGPAVAARHLDGVASPDARDPAPIGSDPPGERRGCDMRGLYLVGDDLPDMTLVQDSATSGPDDGDYAYAACDGMGTGLRVWLGLPTQSIWRIVDIRFAFPDAARAAAYHAERLVANSEGHPALPDAPLVGDECHVFGGSRAMAPLGVDMTMFFYVFRVGAVVVKLFVAPGPQATQPLDIEDVHAIAQRVIARLATVDRDNT